MEAGTLNCPECGAVVENDATQCQYCHALLQTVACPHCMGMMFAGTKFCPHCGKPVQTVVQGANTNRQCPRCKVKLQDVQVADTPLEECTRCGGIWVDIASFEFICANAEAQTAVVDLQLPAPVPQDERVHYLPCPQCGNLMSRTNYASRSGVIINICREHGIWLDRDQMRQIIEFVRAGGLDRARRLEKEELAEERRATAFNPVDTETFLAPSPFHESINSSDRAHLLRGIASVANHFLGDT